MDTIQETSQILLPFFDQPDVHKVEIPVGPGVPFGFTTVTNPYLKIGGVLGTWGECYDNARIPELVLQRMGEELLDNEKMDLATLGFLYRHHISRLSPQQQVDLEVEVGRRLLVEAAQVNGWDPQEVEAVMIGMSGPVTEDYIERIAEKAGIPQRALKVSVHKACDGSMGALHLALNPALEIGGEIQRNLAHELKGKKVLVGGIEGLSRFIEFAHDKNALQLFGNGAGVFGVIPGESMQFLVGRTYENFDAQGVLAVHMYYPHRGRNPITGSYVDIQQASPQHLRFAGMMNEPEDGTAVIMAGPMGMVKLFVRTGVGVVRNAYQDYRALMAEQGRPEQAITVVIAHHANLKINKLKQRHLEDEGIFLEMPWLMSEFGNVSAASNSISFLRWLPNLRPGDHLMFDGFGAGTYYDVFVVEFPG